MAAASHHVPRPTKYTIPCLQISINSEFLYPISLFFTTTFKQHKRAFQHVKRSWKEEDTFFPRPYIFSKNKL